MSSLTKLQRYRNIYRIVVGALHAQEARLKWSVITRILSDGNVRRRVYKARRTSTIQWVAFSTPVLHADALRETVMGFLTLGVLIDGHDIDYICCPFKEVVECNAIKKTRCGYCSWYSDYVRRTQKGEIDWIEGIGIVKVVE